MCSERNAHSGRQVRPAALLGCLQLIYVIPALQEKYRPTRTYVARWELAHHALSAVHCATTHSPRVSHAAVSLRPAPSSGVSRASGWSLVAAGWQKELA